ncbi:response regulator transcription factor [Clostridium sporogenes]|uniref:Stage 0 sporulation protein A homolog n=1 Tax=Clostridium botulinum TaxID=1491 RepID=A0A6M0SW10_CLOBO|nr:response regulator transcription factor [Clostridium sporogenes]NFA59698.1 response regulator transcription factor [Clostridium botulinum]NFI73171.1 response regulator transcription factor [Clostridium sporogenes]NFL73210.1 response regulator transcription factor [Clostridium sporogenes]NFM24730.1 response regulator transcription factor [Clostridium sporogenes]NFP60583.1 response regulator transcription factor [Clostridium sporogenes]
MPKKILVVEDDFDIQTIISEVLKESGYLVERATDGLMAVEMFRHGNFDLIILDIMMPKIDGFVVCEIIRKESNMPIIMLTALGEEEDEMKGFELKIDDYITKPFSINLLIKRVEAVLRRATNLEEKESILSFEEITIDPSYYKTLVNNKEVELTYKEFQILEILISNVGRVFSRETLLNKIWGYDYFGDSRVIDTHIKNLRQKLNVDYIKTIRGVGYKIEK